MTVFERIINREIPATIEFEDDEIIAIKDIAPNAPVHILIIPKTVIPSVNELEQQHQALVGKVFTVARHLAQQHGIAASGYRVVTNVNQDAGQTVPHLHFHLLGGTPLGSMNTATPVVETKPLPPSTSKNMRDIILFVVASVGLALAFNTMNPKRIPWVKPTFEHSQASDAILGLVGPATDPHNTSSSTSAQEAVTEKNTVNQNSEKPTEKSGVVSVTPNREQTEQAATFTAQPGVVLEINLSQFKRLLAGPHFLIDARTPETYAAGHIGNATNVYGGEVESKIPEMLGIVPTDKVILIYCDGGECELSHHVANALKQFGYGPICIFTGGWAEWTKKKAATH